MRLGLGQRNNQGMSESMKKAVDDKKNKKLSIPRYLERLNDNFFGIVTAQQVFLNKMDKMKSKIQRKVKKMPTLIKGELKHQATLRLDS